MNRANEAAIGNKQITVKDSETEILQQRALGLLREAEERVAKEKYEKYLGYIKKFAVNKLKKTPFESKNLSAEEIKAVDFLMTPRAKRVMKVFGLVNLAFVGAVSALAIFGGFVYLVSLSLLVLNPIIALDSHTETNEVAAALDFLRRRRAALEYLKNRETKKARLPDGQAKIKTED